MGSCSRRISGWLLGPFLLVACGTSGNVPASIVVDASAPPLDSAAESPEVVASADGTVDSANSATDVSPEVSVGPAVDADSPDASSSSPLDRSICNVFSYAKQDYVSRTGYNWGDSWMMSWSGDGKTYTNFSDGKLSATAPKVSNAILTIDDDLPNLQATSFHAVSQDPLGVTSVPTWAYYIINTIFIGQTMYVGLVDFSGNGGLAQSTDSGVTLVYDRSFPMWPAGGAKPFVYPSFLQNGRGYEGNGDGFMYVYASDGQWGGTNALRIARVSVSVNLLDVNNYTYYNGVGWSADLASAVNILGPSDDLGGMQSIVYNPVFNRYFLVTFGDTTNVPGPAHMSVFDAPNPWGPFYSCGTISRQDAIFKDIPNQATEIYNPSFNAKWIDSDGSMWISYSSCCEDAQYTFQYGRIAITP